MYFEGWLHFPEGDEWWLNGQDINTSCFIVTQEKNLTLVNNEYAHSLL